MNITASVVLSFFVDKHNDGVSVVEISSHLSLTWILGRSFRRKYHSQCDFVVAAKHNESVTTVEFFEPLSFTPTLGQNYCHEYHN